MRPWLVLVFSILVLAFACDSRDSGGGGAGQGDGGSAGAGAHPGGAGGSTDPCDGVEVTEAECPPGSAMPECFCLSHSQPCLGLDEDTCQSVRGAAGWCEAIHGGNGGDATSCQRASSGYIGCASLGAEQEVNQVLTCAHPAGQSEDCCQTPDALIPDGWVECGGCDCTAGITASECTAGSKKAECCCHFPDSNPCEGLDQGECTTLPSAVVNSANKGHLCQLVMGHAWDPTTMQPTGPEIYIGCRSQCVVEQPHGEPTCTHAPDSTTCGLAEDARIPDGWSTDCSVCTPPG